MGLNLDELLSALWDKLGLCRVYTKKPGNKPDFDDPLILTSRRDGFTVTAACMQIHNTLVKQFRCAVVWGKSSKYHA